jgi:hypothetical protein
MTHATIPLSTQIPTKIGPQFTPFERPLGNLNNAASHESARFVRAIIQSHIFESGGGLTMEQLIPLVCTEGAATAALCSPDRLRKHLFVMSQACHVFHSAAVKGRTWFAHWSPLAHTRAALCRVPKTIGKAAVQPYVGQVAAPRQVNVMHCPTYQPEPALCTRPGAMDFKACASRGDRC